MPPPTPLANSLMLDALPHAMRALAEGTVAIALLLIAFALRRRKFMISTWSFVLLANAFFCDVLASEVHNAHLEEIIAALAIVFFAFAWIRIVIELFERVVRRKRAHFSTIFKDLLTILLYAVVVMLVLRIDFNVNLAALGFTSLAVGTILGLAAQETLGNVFSGLTLQLQRPFTPGDWVNAGNRVGRVQGVGIRSTTVLTRANERLEIPNSLVSKDVLTNYATGAVGDEVSVGISYSVPPNRVREVVFHVLRDVSHVLSDPHPEVLAWEYGDSAIKYRIKYWIRDYGVQEQVRDTIVSSLWYALRRHAIQIPFPIRTVEMRQPAARVDKAEADYEREITRELRQVDLFRELSDADLKMLTPTVQVREFGTGEVLMRQGEAGESAYIIRRGKVEILVHAPDGSNRHVADGGPSYYCGEAALLLGEPRNATIRAVTDVEVLEIDREGFTRLFKEHPEAAAEITEVIAAREQERREALAHSAEGDGTRGRRSRLMAKMREIFDF